MHDSDSPADGCESPEAAPDSKAERSEKPLSLLLEVEPWYRGFFSRVRDLVHPEELPPLELTSQPVSDCAASSHRFNKAASSLSLLIHVLVIGVLLIPVGKQAVEELQEERVVYAPLTLPSSLEAQAAGESGGGGSGGDRSPEPASEGQLPELSMQQKAPPVVIIRNQQPKLPVEPTVIVPPELRLPTTVNMAQLGDPWSLGMVPSSGPGDGGGIGDSSGTGVGSGKGPGAGPGEGSGCCGGQFGIGGRTTAPEVVFQVEPEYSDEARKAKYQGTVVIRLTVRADGSPSDLEVITPLGMGLDEKAVEAVKQWKFRPARRGEDAVAVSALIEVTFRLL
jgi:TonB family protein